ncbi:metallophosphatase family protein [Aeromonas jandaei]|uniref:Metallophosphoesterase family protein n=1 Tax=Aeromonas jandaei TaxID=650 RepID=A0A7T4AAQ2_AERJA|nr:metallophosphoesterase family protein [Aeromonas jandaei]QQB20418.1 metallophosphoesterase family protein [Aeromonas jandaei]UCA35118.1 metallophosphatase family protein [Aeromonas jandaei]
MIAILTDIHGNFPALEAVVEDAQSQGATEFISLGDVAGYGAQVPECIDLLKELSAINILGNHDRYIINNENCPRSRVVSQIIAMQKSSLGDRHLAWLENSVNKIEFEDVLMVHGGPDDLQDQYLYQLHRDLIPVGKRWLFSGHTHVQSLVYFDNGCYCNPGSVGQPRDGDWRTGYALFDGKCVRLRRLEYDLDRTILAMKNFGLEAFCYENLRLGAQIGGRIDFLNIER